MSTISRSNRNGTKVGGLLLDPERLEEVLAIVLDRRQERAERRAAHAAELRKKAAEAGLGEIYEVDSAGGADSPKHPRPYRAAR